MSTRYTVANENNAPKATPNADSESHAVRCLGLEKPHGKRLRLLGGPTPTSLKLLLLLSSLLFSLLLLLLLLFLLF